MLSIFAPPGHRLISGREPIGKRYYNDKVRNYGADQNFPDDEYLRGKLYADAMLSASIHLLLDRARAELHPLSTQTFLPLHEQEIGAKPLPGDTLKQRRERVYALRRLNLNGRISTIHAALKDFLGDDLSFYRTTRVSELRTFDKGPQNRTNFLHVGRQTPIRLIRFIAPIVRLNVSLKVPTEFVGGDPEPYTVGQVVLVDPGRNSRGERVTIEAIDDTSLTATFRQPHDKHTVVTSGHNPRYRSTKRMHHIVLRNGAASNPHVVATLHELMRRLVKGAAVWQVLEETNAAEAGPFQPGVSPPGITPIGELAS